jgi:signal transduction histidine kinase
LKRRSLTFRIVALSGVWVILALAAVAALLLYYLKDHISKHYDDHVLMHMEELVASASLDENGDLVMTAYPSDPRYDILYSGWYWEVRHHGQVLARSHSLGTSKLGLESLPLADGVSVQELKGPGEQTLRTLIMGVPAGQPGEQLFLVGSAPMLGITSDVIDLAEHLLISFVVLAIGLIIAVVLQVRLAMKPVHSVSEAIGNIRAGKSERMEEDYPSDVQPLVDELNNLIDHNTVLLRRARNQLGNLAHSIKNPLTVITNEAHSMEAMQRELILDQASNIRESVDHYLSRARVFGTQNVLGARSQVRLVAEDLAYALKRIYEDRKLEFDFTDLRGCAFRGEAQDLEEMLGNLMDNACKWAKSKVRVRCATDAHRLTLAVEDDGPGIPEIHTELVLERGHRLDDSVKGHGLGLGIVQDITELYDGKLTLSRSELGGLCATLDLPGV